MEVSEITVLTFSLLFPTRTLVRSKGGGCLASNVQMFASLPPRCHQLIPAPSPVPQLYHQPQAQNHHPHCCYSSSTSNIYLDFDINRVVPKPSTNATTTFTVSISRPHPDCHTCSVQSSTCTAKQLLCICFSILIPNSTKYLSMYIISSFPRL